MSYGLINSVVSPGWLPLLSLSRLFSPLVLFLSRITKFYLCLVLRVICHVLDELEASVMGIAEKVASKSTSATTFGKYVFNQQVISFLFFFFQPKTTEKLCLAFII